MSQGDKNLRSRQGGRGSGISRSAAVCGRVLWKLLVPVSLAGAGLPLWWTLASWSVVRTESGLICRVTQVPGPEQGIAGPFSSASDACRAAVEAIKKGQCTAAVKADKDRCSGTPSDLEIKTAADKVVAYPWKGESKSSRLSVFLALDQFMTFPPHFGSDRIRTKSSGGVPCNKTTSELTIMLGSGGWKDCLGHMADPRTLVTAGHCLKFSKGNPQPISFSCGEDTGSISADCVTAAGTFDLKRECTLEDDFKKKPKCQQDIAVCKLKDPAACVKKETDDAVTPYDGHRVWIDELHPKTIRVQSNLGGKCAKFDSVDAVGKWPESAAASQSIQLRFLTHPQLSIAEGDSGATVLVEVNSEKKALGVVVTTGSEPLVIPIWVLDKNVWKAASSGGSGLEQMDGAHR